jgi:hypothetical protein
MTTHDDNTARRAPIVDEENWQSGLFIAVIAVEALCILALWAFGRYFES